MALAETAPLAVKLTLQDGLSSGLRNAQANLGRFDRGVSGLGSKLRGDFSRGVSTAARNIEHMGFIAGGLAIGAGVAAVKWAGDFEAGMNTINTVALKTPEVLAKAGEGLRSLFRETGVAMADLQAAEYDLVSAGIKLEDSQMGVNTAVHLGIGALGSTAEAVDVLTTAINSYNLKAADGSVATATWTRLSDELAQAVADGKVKLSEIAATYAQVAPVAAQAGISTGEIAAALGYLTAKGNPAAETLTQMNRAIIELSKPKGKLLDVLNSLGTTGTELIKKNGLGGALEIIRQQADKLKIPFVELFGRVEAYKFALQTTGPNAEGFALELDRIAHSAGMTNKQFDERAQGFNYQMGVFRANVQDAGITIGTALLPKLTEMATKAADFLRGHQGDIKAFATELAAGFEKAANWAMKLDWNAIGASLKGLAGFGKSIAEGFLSLKPQDRELLIGLFALNKLTGGAVIKIGVDLAGGLIGGLGRAVGSALAGAGLGKFFVQPVFVTNMGVGGFGGAAGAAAGAAGAGGTGIIATVTAAAGALAAGAGLGLLMAAVGEWVLANSKDPTGVIARTTTATARGLPASSVNPTRGFGQIDPLADWVKANGGLQQAVENLGPDIEKSGGRTVEQLKLQQKGTEAKTAALRETFIEKMTRLDSKADRSNALLEGIRAKRTEFRPSFLTTVKVNAFTSVSVRDTNQATTSHSTYNATFANKMTRLEIF